MQKKSLTLERHVWLKAIPTYPNPNQDAFLQAKVIEIQSKQITLEFIGSQGKYIKAPIENVLKLTYGLNDVADMVDLQQLNQPQLLYNIKRRYINDMIFTYCGPTLVIINPYAYIEKLFNDTVLQDYQTMVFTDNLEYKSLPPHIFALAAFCLWQLFDNGRNQSIVISGQSGAGKTQNTKSCLKFLASLGRNMNQLVNDPQKPNDPSKSHRRINYQNMRNVQKTLKRTNSKVFGLQQKILGCNEILQAFGNSKTIRNDNSSRFGKLILLVYGQTQIDIRSAFIISYLLEKSRIVSVSDGQRNYHIFYYFCKGTTPQQKNKYKITQNIQKYYYLNQSSTYSIPNCSDQNKFKEIKKQFGMYLTDEETDCVYRILSIVLNIGNIKFAKSETKNNQEMVTIINEQYIKNVTELLEVQYELFKHCFTFKTIKEPGGKIIDSPLKYDQAIALRDSFSKNFYEKVFNFLVSKLNEKIEIQKINFDQESRQKRKSIGLLDIFGFQVLLINSLQQFFINFANQKLQQLYVSYIFKQQQNQFLKQGLQEFSHDIGFQDNKPIIDLFQSHSLCIFNLINQSSKLNKLDQDLPQTIIKNHPNSKVVMIPKLKKQHFQINHSCSPVSYYTVGFTAKNKDQFPKKLLQAIKTTQNSFMKEIITMGQQKQDNQNNNKKSAAPKSLGTKFLSEMNKLVQQLYSCDCHFVRCIKPNSKKQPKLFNSDAVLQSLRYLGVLDSIKIRKLGYIYRRPYAEFYKKFYELQRYIFSYNKDIHGKTEQDFKEISRIILEKYAKTQLDNKDILFGAKKILIKQSALNHLELLTKEKKRQRIIIANKIKTMYNKAIFRGKVKNFIHIMKTLKNYTIDFSKKVKFKIMEKKVSRIQNTIKKYLWHARLEKIKVQATKSVTKIAAYLKMKKQRKWFLNLKKNMLKVQANVRCYLSMNKFFKQKMCLNILKSVLNSSWEIIRQRKALLIQKVWKGYKVRKSFKEIIKMMKMRAFMKRAIVKFRVNSFKQMLEKYKKPVLMLQAIVRGRYARRTFLQIRKSALIIQKAYKRHLRKKFYLNKIWQKAFNDLSKNQLQKHTQLSRLGITYSRENQYLLSSQIFSRIKKIQIKQTSSLLQHVSASNLRQKFLPNPPQIPANLRINQTIQTPKNTLQLYLLDIDIISTLTYKGNWTQNYSTVKTQMSKKSQYPIKLGLTQQFTYLVGNKDRIWAFTGQSQEQENQQKKLQKIQSKSVPKIVTAGNGKIYVLGKQGGMYEWGLINYGRQINTGFINSQINPKDIEIKGSKFFYTDLHNIPQTPPSSPQPSLTNFKTQISCIVSSYTFTHFLTQTGQLYSLGSNTQNQLGLNIPDTLASVTSPTLNPFFSSKPIDTISVGYNHTILKTRQNHIYGWGDNRSNQLGQQQSTIKLPINLVQGKGWAGRVLQAVASGRASYLLVEGVGVIGTGTSGGRQRKQFGIIDLLNNTNANPKNLIIVKISTAWNRQMSILTANCLQLSKTKPNTKPEILLKYSKTLSKQWQQKQIYPQYSQWMDNILNISDMRRFKFSNKQTKKTNKKNQNYQTHEKQQGQLGQLKILMDLRKTSGLFKNAAREKVKDILQRLAHKGQLNWNQQDHELNIYIKDNCQAILK